MASVGDDYIDMDLRSSSSPPKAQDFEFKMPNQSSVASPADELFYKGKLLPLLLSPRRLMVEKLRRLSVSAASGVYEEEDCGGFTPSDSCNISPSESCRVSCEMNPEDFLEWSTELSSCITTSPSKKPWWTSSKTVKLIKRLIVGKGSWFARSGCSYEIPVAAEENSESRKTETVPQNKGFGQAGKLVNYSSLASMIKSLEKDGNAEEANSNPNPHRRSFSGAIKRHPPTAKSLSPSSSSSSSSSSITSNEQHFLRRSTSATDIEGSIEAAIAHCKRSQQCC